MPDRARRAPRAGRSTGETRHRQAAYEGSFRQRRGVVLAQLRAGPAATGELDGEALASLLDDGLAEVDARSRAPPAQLSARPPRESCASGRDRGS